MEEEFKNFIKVWISAIISISYCYYIPTKIKSGLPRLLSVLPICILFLILPLFLSSLHFSGSSIFFLSWLANFKLILFAFNQPPLFPLPPNLLHFIFFTCFPIKPQQNPNSQINLPKSIFAIKVAIFALLLHLYGYKQSLPSILVLGLSYLHVYLELEILLMIAKALVFIFLRCDLEPQSNEPYLATSLQDFWGHRWNLMVPAILRPAVYYPVRRLSQRWVKPGLAILIGVFATFIVSGLVHEVIFLYITHENPTGEVTCFFLLHGVCTTAEIAVKKTALGRRWRLNPVVSRLLTVTFVVVTGGWLFFPHLIRNSLIERLTNEVISTIDFIKLKLF